MHKHRTLTNNSNRAVFTTKHKNFLLAIDNEINTQKVRNNTIGLLSFCYLRPIGIEGTHSSEPQKAHPTLARSSIGVLCEFTEMVHPM